MTDYTPEDEAVAEDMARQGLLGQGTVEVRRKVAARLQAARSQGREAGLDEAARWHDAEIETVAKESGQGSAISAEVFEDEIEAHERAADAIRALKSEPSRLEEK